jgi:hypothetical protein
MDCLRRSLASLFRRLARRFDRPACLADLDVAVVGGRVVLARVDGGMAPIELDPGEAKNLSRWLHEGAGSAIGLEYLRAAGLAPSQMPTLFDALAGKNTVGAN